MKEVDEQVQRRCGLIDPVGCVEKLAHPWCEMVVEFLIGGQLGEDGNGIGCCEVNVLWYLRGSVGVTVVLEGPSSVVHFGQDNLAAVEGL